MEEEEDFERIKACFPPESNDMAMNIYRIIADNASVASEWVGGMSPSFIGLNKLYLMDVAEKFHAVELDRYETYIEIFENKLRAWHRKSS